MTRLRIKLCGVRRARDAELCAQAGADEIGVVFAPHSRRCVTVAGLYASGFVLNGYAVVLSA